MRLSQEMHTTWGMDEESFVRPLRSLSLTLNEEVDVAEYPLAPDTRDTIEPWRRKLVSDP